MDQTGNRVSGKTVSETVRKGYEQRSERGFGRYTEHKMDRKAPPCWPVRLRWKRLRDFSDSLSETVRKIAEGLLDEAFSAAKGQNGAKKARFSY